MLLLLRSVPWLIAPELRELNARLLDRLPARIRGPLDFLCPREGHARA
jgi:hypothetical protein